MWDVVSGEQTTLLGTENGWVEHLAWTPDGKVLASAARKTISLWRGSESLGIWYDARRQVLAMAWAPDSKRLATAANKGLYLWRMQDARNNSSEPMQLLSFPGAPVALAWRPNGRALAVGTQDGFLQVWRQATGKSHDDNARQLTMRGYRSKVNCLAWHPRRGIIATAGGPDVVLWELPEAGKGARGQPLRHHQDTVTTLELVRRRAVSGLRRSLRTAVHLGPGRRRRVQPPTGARDLGTAMATQRRDARRGGHRWWPASAGAQPALF